MVLHRRKNNRSVDKNSIDGLKECIESPHQSTLFTILFVQTLRRYLWYGEA